MSPVILLPTITIQHDLPAVHSDLVHGLCSVEQVWSSCYNSHPSTGLDASVHGKIRLASDEDDQTKVTMEGKEGIEVEQISTNELRISCPSLRIPATAVSFPGSNSIIFDRKNGSSTSIELVRVSSDGMYFAVGGKEGKLRLGETKDLDKVGSPKLRELRGHASDITAMQLFPSNHFLLTSSLDMTIKVFSLKTGENILTLQSHTRPVTSLEFLHSTSSTLEFLSASLDGTIKIWSIDDEGISGSVLHTLRLDSPISFMTLLHPSPSSSVPHRNQVVVGHQSGAASIVDLTTFTSPIITPLSTAASPGSTISSIDTISYADGHLIALGNLRGVIQLYLYPASSSLTTTTISSIASFKRSTTISSAAITSLFFSSPPPSSSAHLSSVGSTTGAEVNLLVGTSDGLPFRATISLPSASLFATATATADEAMDATKPGEEVVGEGGVRVKVATEFAGIDCDSAVVTSYHDKNGVEEVWIGGGDGVLRRYSSV